MVLPRPLIHRLGLVAALAALAGCGGGDEPPATTADSTGVLSDSPVKGVQYLRNGAAAGSTDILGQFRYQAGETLEFRLGKLSLGRVAGTGSTMTVTPLQLVQDLPLTATQRAHRVTNLLVLLQGLDVDGDPADGLSIPAAVTGALESATMAASIDLNADPASFASDPDLDIILGYAGASAAKPSASEALAHFRAQLLGSLAGSWLGSIGSNAAAFRFRDNGSYLMGEVGAAGNGGSSGVELGGLDWDPATGYVTVATPLKDSNGSWGLSYISALPATTRAQLTLDGDELVVTERNVDTGAALASYRIPRHYNSSGSLAGTWAKGSAASLNALHLFMRNDGLVMAVNPGPDTSLLGRTSTGCARPGVEFGNYRPAGGYLLFSNIGSYDTDGCGGLHDANLAPDYLLADGTHVQPQLSGVTYASAMDWSWFTNAGPQSATLYRPNNAVPLP